MEEISNTTTSPFDNSSDFTTLIVETDNEFINDSYDIRLMSQASAFISNNIEPSLPYFGILGNILTFAVFCKNAFNPTALFLGALAVSDLCHNVTFVVYWIFAKFLGSFDLTSCKVLTYFGSLFSLCSPWLINCMTLEKFIAVKYPIQFRQFHNKKVLISVILTIFLISSFTEIPITYTAYIGSGERCNVFDGQNPITKIYSVIWSVTHFVLPFLILGVFNCLIIISIRKSRQTVQKYGDDKHGEREAVPSTSEGPVSMENDERGDRNDIQDGSRKLHRGYAVRYAEDLASPMPSEHENEGQRNKAVIINSPKTTNCLSGDFEHVSSVEIIRKRNKTPKKMETSVTEKQMTRMFFVVTLSFFIFMVPAPLRLLVFSFYKRKTVRDNVVHQLVVVCSRCLFTANFSINFYLYVAFSEKFRKNVIQLFRK